ncbi:HEPN domain protein [Thermoplasmatales archaeon]|nr:HEPN domain protein [Thermoplasmatales archaeon]
MLPLDDQEFERWYSSAEKTLRSALSDHNTAFYNWACFKAQQASEFAVKAYLRGIGSSSYGHSVSHLMMEAGFEKDAVDMAKTIDKYYIPTRYTDAWSDGTPEEYYSYNDSSDSIDIAKKILEAVRKKWMSLRKE